MASLIRDGAETLPDAGIFALQQRQRLVPNPVAREALGGIAAVDPKFKAVIAQIFQDLGFLKSQERARQSHAGSQGARGENPGQGLKAAAAQQAQQNALGLIVQVVRGRGLAAAKALGLLGQGRVAQRAPGLLKPQASARRGLGHRQIHDPGRHAELAAELQDEARVLIRGAAAQAVVEMHEEHAQAAAAALRPEIVPQTDGIGASRNRGHDPIARREKPAFFLRRFQLRPNARGEGFSSHARIVSNCVLGLFLAMGAIASKPRPGFCAGGGVAVSTAAPNAALAQAYAARAQSEFNRAEYWSSWRDAGYALRLGPPNPQLVHLRAQAYVKAMAKETVKISSGAAGAHPPALAGKVPSTVQAKAAAPPARPVLPARRLIRAQSSGLSGLISLPALAASLGLILLIGLIVMAGRLLAPRRPRRDLGKSHATPEEVPAAAPLLKAGAVLGGRFILGALKEEVDGVCVYEGRDLGDESLSIARYPHVPGGLERASKAVDFKHPCVAHLRGVFASGVHIFAAYELLRGDSLRRLLERLPERRYSPEQALRLLKNLCEALGAAHALGLCHGPLTPGEIIIGPSQVKVRGFGLWPVAALAYAAPEFSPQNGDSTPSSDLFSLAACLYEMLTGKSAFFESRSLDGSRLFAPPSQKARDLGPAVDAFFAKALSPEPDKRFASAADFFSAFSALVVPKSPAGKDAKV